MRSKIPRRRLVIGVDEPRIRPDDAIVIVYSAHVEGDAILELPPAADADVLCVVQADASPGQVLVRCAIGDTITTYGDHDGFRLDQRQQAVTAVSDGENGWIILAGDPVMVIFSERRRARDEAEGGQ